MDDEEIRDALHELIDIRWRDQIKLSYYDIKNEDYVAIGMSMKVGIGEYIDIGTTITHRRLYFNQYRGFWGKEENILDANRRWYIEATEAMERLLAAVIEQAETGSMLYCEQILYKYPIDGFRYSIVNE